MSDQSHRLISELLDSSPDALVVADEQGVVVLATNAVGEMFGYEPDQLVGMPVDTLLPSALQGIHLHHRGEYATKPEPRPMGVGVDLRAARRDGSDFPVDVGLVPVVVEGQRYVGAFVRDATRARRDEDLLRFVNEISRITIEGWDTGNLLRMVAARARRLVGAEVAWVAVRVPGQDRIVVAAADGVESDNLIGATIPESTSLAARAMTEGKAVLISDMTSEARVLSEARHLGLGPGLYQPMMAEDGPVGTLVLARSSESDPFSESEVDAAEVFSSAAAIVIALGNARRALEETRLLQEHERIARDLHDTVIQRLFAVGMRLQATQRVADGPAAERIRESVDAIDDVIRDIRETIFDLNRPGVVDRHVRDQLREVAAEASIHLGFAPRLAFRGPVETAVWDDLAPHLVAVVREGLTNVSRHAQASRVDVVISVGEGRISVSVADDGIGLPSGEAAGHGLANMRARADMFGGSTTLGARHPVGTLMEWSVPLLPP